MTPLTLGVVADTHIPDRARRLNPILLGTFRSAGVSAILHCGDVCVPEVLELLATIAPVHAVQGNRDIYRLNRLPKQLVLEFAGVKIGLMHGHGSWRNYLYERVNYVLHGLQPEYYRRRAVESFEPAVQVVAFGHYHLRVKEWVAGRLLFNPGSACCPENSELPPSAGLLHISAEGEIEAEHFFLA